MRQILTIEQAKSWLVEHEFGRLRAELFDPYYGKREATVCNGKTCVMVLSPKSRRRGYMLDWSWIKKIWKEVEVNQTPKYLKKALKATFTNPFIRKCLNADLGESPYKNGLSTGVPIEGKIISLKSIGRQYPWLEQGFRAALRDRKNYDSHRMPFRGYEASLSVKVVEKDYEEGYYKAGDVMGYLSLEYKDCGNGYYYLLINDDEFIGYDID